VDNQTFKHIPKNVKDLVEDIAFGICNSQKLIEAENGTYDMSKVKKYNHKTQLHNIINDALKESNYRDSYEWKYERKFVYDGDLVELIKYDITTRDLCYLKIDGEDKKVSKKYFKEMWKNREVEGLDG
jgi:hypothetical protein